MLNIDVFTFGIWHIYCISLDMLLCDVGHLARSRPLARVSRFTVLYDLSYCQQYMILLNMDSQDYYACDPRLLHLELMFTWCYVKW